MAKKDVGKVATQPKEVPTRDQLPVVVNTYADVPPGTPVGTLVAKRKVAV